MNNWREVVYNSVVTITIGIVCCWFIGCCSSCVKLDYDLRTKAIENRK